MDPYLFFKLRSWPAFALSSYGGQANQPESRLPAPISMDWGMIKTSIDSITRPASLFVQLQFLKLGLDLWDLTLA